jgi:hypothetical protein
MQASESLGISMVPIYVNPLDSQTKLCEPQGQRPHLKHRLGWRPSRPSQEQDRGDDFVPGALASTQRYLTTSAQQSR